MAVTPTPIYPQTLKNTATQITNATGTTITTIYTAGTNGSKVEKVLIASTNASAIDCLVYVTISATSYQLGQISIPATAGTLNTVPPVSLFDALTGSTPLFPVQYDNNGNRYMYLANGSTLSISAASALTATKVWNVLVQAGDF